MCDSEIILSALKNSQDILATMKDVKGPFSFIYYKKSSKKVYFARDRFGRHSLLFKIDENCTSLCLSSTAVKAIQNIAELPAIGIFIADLNSEKICINCAPWFEPGGRFIRILNDFKNQFNIDINIVELNYLPRIENLFITKTPSSEMGFLKYIDHIDELKTFDEIMEYLLTKQDIRQKIDNILVLLNESVRRRVKILPNFCRDCTALNFENIEPCRHAKVGLLFSGGLDSAILAAIAHNHIEPNETIDLINVAFEKKKNSNYNVPDRITGRQTLEELLKICSERKFNFIEVGNLKYVYV